MKKYSFFLALSLVNGLALAEQPLTVEDRGMDGQIRYYSVRCLDDQRLGIEHRFHKGQVCFTPMYGKFSCLSTNDVDLAAKQACALSKKKKRR